MKNIGNLKKLNNAIEGFNVGDFESDPSASINLLMLELQIFSYIKFKTYQSEKNEVKK